MIFVTVGTHEQQFNRLIKCVDELKKNGIIKDEVFMQIGYSTYEPSYCKFSKMLPYTKMKKYIEDAKIIITHGGPASFLMPLQVGKIPIVVPRQKKYGEHVNDHQLDFAKEVEKRKNNIIVIEDVNDLSEALVHYEEKAKNMGKVLNENNKKFNEELEKIVEGLIKKR